MILNNILQNTVSLSFKHSESAKEPIFNMLSDCPFNDIDIETYSTTPSVCMEISGVFNGEYGMWSLIAYLDNDGRVSKLKLGFSEEPSSRKPYTDSYVLSVAGFKDEDKSFWVKSIPMVDYTQSRVYNYRNFKTNKILTASDIKKLSTPVKVAKFSMSAKKDYLTGKFNIVCDEKFGINAYASEDVSVDEQQA